MTVPLHARSLTEIAALIRSREVSPVAVTEDVLARIARLDPGDAGLNSFITVTAEAALEAAREAEAEIAAGRWRGPLHGVPVSVKDLFHVAGVRTTAASRFMEHFVAAEDSAVVERLREAGAVLLGKTNLHEFAYGISSRTSHFGPVRNPWNATCIPGGSSGGSGAAVAAGLGYASIGTDTGGSIRIPAACCGIVGLKPTFGRVSRHGLVPLSTSLDHAGPLTRTVEDAALVLSAIAGYDPRDPGSADVACEGFADGLERGVAGVRVGVLDGAVVDADAEVAAAVRAALDRLADAGAVLRPVRLALLGDARAAALVLLSAEATAVHRERMREHPDWFGADVYARLERGTTVLAVDYVRALEVRRRFGAELAQTFREVDVLVSPMLPIGAPPVDATTVPVNGVAVDVLRAVTANTREWNLLGLPAASVPCGRTAAGLPIAMQIVGPAFAEAAVLRVARAHERLMDDAPRMPPL